MSSLPVFVGLDYHQDSVQVCVLDTQGKQLCNQSVKNDANVIENRITRHGKPRRIAIEACCGAAHTGRGAGDSAHATCRCSSPIRAMSIA